jgi:hypothetical protein
MKTLKLVGCAVALAIAAPVYVSAIATEPAQARMEPTTSSSGLVHRVSHAIAAEADYTAKVTTSGYKWGGKAPNISVPEQGFGSSSSQSKGGYKWARITSTNSTFVEQAANPWGRRDFSEQAANPWGRRDFSEQAANPWGRRDFSEQAANPWGRR